MAILFSYWILNVVLLFLSAIVVAYFYMTRHFGHWKNRGVMEVPPTPFVGNFGSCLSFRLAVFEYLRLLYEKNKSLPYIGFYIFDKPALVLRDPEIIKNVLLGVFEIPPVPFVGNFGGCLLFRLAVAEFLGLLYEQGKGQPFVGFYIFDKPALVVRDPEMIKSVLVKDFNCFWNRYVTSSESDLLGYHNLLLIKNPTWKQLRTKVTPLFSTAKIKNMFLLIDVIGDELINHLDAQGLEGDGRVLELKEICAKYTTDVIGSCAFGLQVNSLKNPDAEFRKFGRRMFHFTYKRGFELMSHFFIPGLAKFRGTPLFESSSSQFLQKVFNATLNERLKSGLKRNDLIDLLLELKNDQDANDDPDVYKFDDDKLVAQAAIFFTAGFETSSTVLSFTLHELSLQPDLQKKLRDELMAALEENDGKISYDVLQRLPYLDQVVSEGLRKYPSLPFLDREARSDFTVLETGLVIKKDTPVYISLLGLHYDPEYYPNPEHFDPERFNEENKRQRSPFVYLPFGGGPRNCIGLRFGTLQVKIGLVKIIANYELTPCEQTLNPIRFNPRSLTLSTVDGLYHRVRTIKTTDD